jgi:hypothetical protein
MQDSGFACRTERVERAFHYATMSRRTFIRTWAAHRGKTGDVLFRYELPFQGKFLHLRQDFRQLADVSLILPTCFFVRITTKKANSRPLYLIIYK